MGNHTPLHEIIVTICTCCSNANIQFCIAGGIAVSIWGHVRATEDLDIIAVIDQNNEQAIINALQKHFEVITHKEEMLKSTLTPIKRYVLIANTSHFILDIIIAHNDFLKHCIRNSKKFTFYGITVPVIALEDLIITKCNTGRYQDIADIHMLVSGTIPINKTYILEQLSTFHIPISDDIKKLILQ